ncbi:hypothetical protein AMATHDRAFT_51084 [Amanita thiersii Skay4041]|uniref:DUF6533 domain-containing protein n=1 Tax=Amanita thiersii Skay4041 TaxID=703135 RepID=A0A2A9NAP3_9AGAR|nr:hypothetical protein AMATHDRAFT_51084 [Amanita thiersii Skay4041]
MVRGSLITLTAGVDPSICGVTLMISYPCGSLVCSITLLIYDHTLTLGREIEYVWSSPLKPIACFYYIMKYSTFINVILVSVGRIDITSVAAGEAILVLKAWAVWGRNTELGIFLLVVILVLTGFAYVSPAFLQRSLRYSSIPGLLGCILSDANGVFLIVIWAGVMATHAVVTGLLLIRGVQTYRSFGKTRLFDVIYKDGESYQHKVFMVLKRVSGFEYYILMTSMNAFEVPYWLAIS